MKVQHTVEVIDADHIESTGSNSFHGLNGEVYRNRLLHGYRHALRVAPLENGASKLDADWVRRCTSSDPRTGRTSTGCRQRLRRSGTSDPCWRDPSTHRNNPAGECHAG